MLIFSWVLAAIVVFSVLSYHRASLIVFTISFALLLGFATTVHGQTIPIILAWAVYVIIFGILNIKPLRRFLITARLFQFYKRIMPTMSRTEREAISAGTVTWEGDIFRGNPDWDKLMKMPPPKLSQEEQDFLEGPVNQLCAMINDWDITHNRADLPQEMWEFLKKEGFFALIIPKEYGGKGFSAYAHSQILTKISGRSITVSSTVAVPNSLGPAELLLHYGTKSQKDYYLPRLARGEEIPCFALTSPEAGSDAGAMSDHGVVCYGEFAGEKILGIRLDFDKRYITLAPIATVIGLAFKLYDPDHLIGKEEDIGITCALIPRETAGMSIGRRHFPLNTPFMNGPIRGKNVFIPFDWIIGGQEKAGKGWGMLMECLAAGRAISLPANTLGGAKGLSYATGAYARIRKQFNVPIGRFEGIEEPLARIAAYTYIMDSGRSLAASSIDHGEKPSVASAIVKYHVTELGRKVSLDAMDIHGGKGICLGPNNYLGRGYQSTPIAITVEGANILTRSLIIFGQGAMRCHPYVLAELEAAQNPDRKKGLKTFDQVVIKHIAFGISNFIRTFSLGFASSLFVQAPKGRLRRYYQHATRFSSAFALLADVSMLVLGGSLKRKESLSARLGDILSYLYLLSAILKHYQDQGAHEEDLPLVRYASEYVLFQAQESFDEILQNFPNRPLAHVLRAMIFPFGPLFKKPKDRYHHKITQLIINPTETRLRLTNGIYTNSENNTVAQVQDAFIKAIAAEPIEKTIRTARAENKISGYTLHEQAQHALDLGIITVEQFDVFTQSEAARKKVIAVDDFTTEELKRLVVENLSTQTYATSDGTNG